LDGSWDVDFAGLGIPLRSAISAPRDLRRGHLLAAGSLKVDVSCDFLELGCMNMAVAIRGPATARFYKTFHAWSKLGSVSHQQRRCFVLISPACEANDAQSTNSRQKTPAILITREVRIPESRFARMQQHPTFLHRIQAELDVKLEPSQRPTDDGIRTIFITAKGAARHRHVRNILRRQADDAQSLDATIFDKAELVNHHPKLLVTLPSETVSLLQDNAEELRLRIQKAFSVQLDIEPEREGAVSDDKRREMDGKRVVVVTGEHNSVTSAKEFLMSVHLDLEEPSQRQEDQVKRPLTESSTPSSIPSEPVQTSPPSTPQSTPRSIPQSASRSTPQTAPQSNPTSLKDVYKATMRNVPSSVVVLTTRVPSAQSNIDSLRGMTVSSLSSITLEPEPIISFSIRSPSRTLDCIATGQPFTVNFLKTDPTGACIADIFSRPHDDPSQPFRIIQASDLADVYEYETDNPSGPAIGSASIPTRFTCELLPGKSLEIGDHTVIFARIIDIWRDHDHSHAFLAYAQAGYRRLQRIGISIPSLESLERAQPIEPAPALPEKSDSYVSPKRVRIGGLPYTAQHEDVKKYVKDAGFRLHSMKMATVVGKRPTYCFVKFLSAEDAERAVRAFDGASFMGHLLTASKATTDNRRFEQRPQLPEVTSGGPQLLNESLSTEHARTEPTSTEPISAEPTSAENTDSDVVDAYWRMALDEGNEDDVLEERAADQRALGEAQKPADHPLAGAEGDKQDK
jgi:flavin reductase (DIM6/NTAB) family NADH-FMN oxidoreductase RutF